jgi:hypothetical protein
MRNRIRNALVSALIAVFAVAGISGCTEVTSDTLVKRVEKESGYDNIKPEDSDNEVISEVSAKFGQCPIRIYHFENLDTFTVYYKLRDTGKYAPLYERNDELLNSDETMQRLAEKQGAESPDCDPSRFYKESTGKSEY